MSDTAQVDMPRPISARLDALSEELTVLEQSEEILFARLGPLLSPAEPSIGQEVPGESEPGNVSSITSLLDTQISRVMGVRRKIDELTTRLEF